MANRRPGLSSLASFSEDAEFSIFEAIGGVRGAIESMLPGLVFVIVYVITRQVELTVIIAGVIAVAQVGLRFIQRQNTMGALSGLLSVAICLIWAWHSHEAKNYYVLGFISNAIYVIGLTISLLIRVPGIGFAIEWIYSMPTKNIRAWIQDWRSDQALNRAYMWVTALWVAVFAARLLVQFPLYLANQVGWLATARLVMGLPLFALLLWVSYLIVATPLHRHRMRVREKRKQE